MTNPLVRERLIVDFCWLKKVFPWGSIITA